MAEAEAKAEAEAEPEAEAETSQCHSAAATVALALLLLALETGGLIGCRGCLIIARGEFLSVAQLLPQGTLFFSHFFCLLSPSLFDSLSLSLLSLVRLGVQLKCVRCHFGRRIALGYVI